MPFFHVTSHNWMSGDVIQPGGWGRQIRQFKPGGPKPNDWNVVLWEVALETARLQFAAEAPSRMDCVFASESSVFAERFRDLYRPQSQVVAVEALDPQTTVHRGDFFLISRSQGPRPAYVDYMPVDAQSYWTSPPPQGHAELVIAGPVRVS